MPPAQRDQQPLAGKTRCGGHAAPGEMGRTVDVVRFFEWRDAGDGQWHQRRRA